MVFLPGLLRGLTQISVYLHKRKFESDLVRDLVGIPRPRENKSLPNMASQLCGRYAKRPDLLPWNVRVRRALLPNNPYSRTTAVEGRRPEMTADGGARSAADAR
ncbi:hypothetical protein DdX_04225 [Ditylenchus destructor]|uniref:Uncharacterized protein n=1 Tax=Ditylenchus destructor TaxID=166010 RepID=A0AAD4NB55_9BILA|nr:hypothetical protein DdX_04225 [Ditylenchus destructor]